MKLIYQDALITEAKRKIEATKWQRLMHIAEFFTEQHLQRIDRLELVENLMWY